MPGNHCPSEDVLGRYATGALPEAHAETLTAHLGECPTCLSRMDRLGRRADTFAIVLRGARAAAGPESPELARAVAAVLNEKAPPAPAPTPGPGPGSVLNGYRILEELGRGGMGRVYRALHPRLGQEVALKVLRPGMDSAPILGRFEAERQALALMDHPHIARVLDGGATEDGQPFFVMELVRGVAVTRYCDEHRLDLPRRLELFIQVCQAVQHAHQKGIIHRDLKPSNVLVAEYDGRPVPKVIDFGVAKALDRRFATDTEIGMLIGTPEYMSPEQADLTALDIDTRSDIYSLGVLLYELLTGDTPLARRRLRATPVLEVLRHVQEDDPPAPSTRLRAADTGVEVAANRATEIHRLTRQVRGELDWIVLKALEKDRARRYETASALGEDVRRYLDSEPAHAGPPGRVYRLQKFMRRHRGPVVAAALVLLAILGGIVGTTVGLVHATRQRALAESASAEKDTALVILDQEQENTKAALNKAQRARAQTMTALRSLTNEIMERQLARQTTLSRDDRAFLERTIQDYDKLAALGDNEENSQAIRAEGALRVGQLQVRLGQKREAVSSLEKAHDLFRQLSAAHPTVPSHRNYLALSGLHLGGLFAEMGRSDEAENAYRESLFLLEKLALEAPHEASYRRSLGMVHNRCGILMTKLRRHADAACAFQQAIAYQERLVTEYPEDTDHRLNLAGSHQNLGVVLRRMKKLPEAEAACMEAVRLRQSLATENPEDRRYRLDLAIGHSNLALLLNDFSKHSEAEAEYRQALRIQKQLVGEFPLIPEYRKGLALTHDSLGQALQGWNRPAEAVVELSEAVTLQDRLVLDFPNIPEYLIKLGGICCNLGNACLANGNPTLAVEWYERAMRHLMLAVTRHPSAVLGRRYLRNSHQGRALALACLERHVEAWMDWGRALELDDGSNQLMLRREQNAARAYLDPAAAREQAERWLQNPGRQGQTLYVAARVFAISASTTKHAAEREQFALRAIDFLKEARQEGFFKTPANLNHLKRLPDFQTLHPRDDFRELLQHLGADAGRSR